MPDPYASVEFYSQNGHTYEYVHDENVAAWRIRHTAPDGVQQYSVDTYDTKTAAALAFENTQIAYREEV